MTDAALPLDPGARRAVLEAVDTLREDAVETLARLVRCPSTLGHEQSALEQMARVYEDLGLTPDGRILADGTTP